MTTFRLAYSPATHLGQRFPSWRFGRFATRTAADACRHQCANAEAIEVVEVEE